MKKLLLLTLLSVFVLGANAQYWYLPAVNTGQNPGGLNNDDEFPFGGGLDASWSLIQATSATPIWTSTQTLPFTFDLSGTPVTQFKVSTTGVVTFDVAATTVPGTNNTALPSASIPDNSVMVWGLAGTGGNDAIVQKTFGTAPNRQHWVFFASYSYPGQGGWTYFSIVFEETTNKIYFVDQRNNNTTSAVNLTMGIQIDGTTAYQEVNSPNVNPNTTSSNADRSDNWYWEFIPGAQATDDLAMSAITVNPFVSAGAIDITGTVSNFGSATVTDFDINYTIDGGAAVTSNISGLSIATLGDYNFTHPVQWNPTVAQAYTLKVWASNPNGNADTVNFNDTLTTTINVVDTVIDRNVLHEQFTSSTCPPCTPGNANVNAVIAASNETPIMLKYQMSWPGTGDPYYTAEAGNRRTYYGVNSVPNMFLDGGWNGNSNSYTGAILTQFSDIPAFLDVHSDIRVECQTVNVDVTLTPYADFPGNNILHIAVIEKETFNNIKTNGETEFQSVFKKMIPNASGTSIGALTKNNPVTQTFSYTFNGNYILPPDANSPVNHANTHTVEEFFDLDVVAFVQNNSTQEVYHASFSQDLIGYDMAIASLNSISSPQVGNPIAIGGMVQNWKDSTTTSFDVHYQVDNGTVISRSYTGQTLDRGDDLSFSFLVGYTPTTAGQQTLKVWIDNFNGGTVVDGSPCNDTVTVVLNVQQPAAPTADFTYAANGLTVDFTDASTFADDHFWDFGEGGTSTDANPTYTYTAAGTYQVCLTAINGLGSDQKCETLTIVGLDEANALASAVDVFPNPSKGVFEVLTGEALNGVIVVTDLVGRTVQTVEMNSWVSGSVDLSEVKKGMYILNLNTDKGNYSQSIVIE